MAEIADPADAVPPRSARLESALRWLATRKHAKPLRLIAHAIQDPESDSSARLEPLVTATLPLPESTSETRALAVWGLVVQCIDSIGADDDSRRRNVLYAGFRLARRGEITEPWKSTLEDRFKQLKGIPGIFGNPQPSTTTPMHKAWKQAISDKLTPMLRERLPELAGDWSEFVEIARRAEAEIARELSSDQEDAMSGYRAPSRSAQPVFLNLFVTTVFMKYKAVYRRITERLLTARADGVDGYTARALAGPPHDRTRLQVAPLWNCDAPGPVPSRTGERGMTRLGFPRPLRRGEMHYFASETINEDTTEERYWVNVEVDHHGIAPGRLVHDRIPVSGLTIRIQFDESCLPAACWWYAEQTERERRERPPDGDSRRLTVVGNTVIHTFTEKCHPRDNYGVGILWPDEL